MPRIAGVDIPLDKPIRISLRYIYGIGPANAMADPEGSRHRSDEKSRDLTEDELGRIVGIIDRSLPGRRRPAPADPAEHPAAQGHRLLPRQPAPPQPAGPRPAHAVQRPHPQGPAKTVAGKKGVKELHGK